MILDERQLLGSKRYLACCRVGSYLLKLYINTGKKGDIKVQLAARNIRRNTSLIV
jgi:hypothetical protein